jgi:excisionase family DNA binding protein
MVDQSDLPIISPVGPVYKTDEAAVVLKVSARTVQRLIRQGKLKCHKIGRSYRILGRDIEQFFAQQETSSPDNHRSPLVSDRLS